MHAHLFTGATLEVRLKAISDDLKRTGVPPFDRVTLSPSDKASVGISDTRIFIKGLHLTPHTSAGTAGIIPDMAALTPEAQQALLKTIEEPPPNVQLYMGSASDTMILPTIISRCHVTALLTDAPPFTEEELSRCRREVEELLNAGYGKRIQLIQSLGTTKDDIKRWTDIALVAIDTHHPALSHALFAAKSLMSNNVNPTQLLEHVFLVTPI